MSSTVTVAPSLILRTAHRSSPNLSSGTPMTCVTIVRDIVSYDDYDSFLNIDNTAGFYHHKSRPKKSNGMFAKFLNLKEILT